MEKYLGIFIILISVTFYALISVLFKKASQQTPPFSVMAISMFALFTSAVILSLIFEKGSILKAIWDKNLFLLLIGVGLLNLVGFWLAILGYKFMPLWQQTLFTLLTPVLTGIFAYFVLGEVISMKLFLGLIIMGLGLFIAIR